MSAVPLALAALLATALPPAVELKPIRYDGLIDALKSHTGKVVVVDFWADYCVPCKREFPHLVELNRQYGGLGFVAISVTLDDPTDDAARGRALKFLQAKQATFANYLLDEKTEVWQQKLKIDGPPLVMVFNQRGEKEKEFKDDVKYDEIEKIVARLLGK
jgi:thiol-disulfide isomerase/thioredoxin